MRCSRFLPIAVIALIPVLGPPAYAQGNGKMTPYVINLYKVEDTSSGGSVTINLKGKVWVSTLVGEPVIACNAQWSFWNGVGGEPVISINNKHISDIPREVLDKITLHSVKLGFETKPLDTRMFARNTPYEVSCDPGAMEKPGGKPSFTVPGSYSWDEMFYVRDSYDGENKSSAKYADKATSKQIMIHLLEKGFSTDSGSAKVLTAQLNLGAVVDWLDAEEKLAAEKLAEELNKAAEKKVENDQAAAKDKNDFWNSLWGGGKKDEAKKKDDFWSGKQASKQEPKKDGGDKFWSGNTADERKKRQAEIQKQQDLEHKQQAAAEASRKAADAAMKLTLFRDKKSRQYGFKIKAGEIVIPVRFRNAYEFSEGLAISGYTDSKDAGREDIWFVLMQLSQMSLARQK